MPRSAAKVWCRDQSVEKPFFHHVCKDRRGGYEPSRRGRSVAHKQDGGGEGVKWVLRLLQRDSFG